MTDNTTTDTTIETLATTLSKLTLEVQEQERKATRALSAVEQRLQNAIHTERDDMARKVAELHAKIHVDVEKVPRDLTPPPPPRPSFSTPYETPS